MNVMDEVSRGRLFAALESSYRALEPFRNLNRLLVEEYSGSGYGDNPNRRETVVNLMNQAVDAYTMVLVANRPRVLLSTDNPQKTYFAKQYQYAINALIEEIGLERTLRRWVLDAFFSLGIIKVHMADSGQVMLEEGFWMDPGTPFASNVGLDNWVHDMTATRWDQVKFAADSYRLPLADLQDNPAYDQEVVKELQATSKYSTEGDRLEQISRGTATDNDDLEPMVDLCDVWVPRDGKIYTFAMSNRGKFQCKGAPLAIMDWNGPEGGPYHLLGFNEVPENIMPTSPASHLASLNRMVNNIFRKQKRRIQNLKRNHLYTPAGADAAKRIQGGNDDEWIQCDDPTQIGVHESGGVDPNAHAFMLSGIETFDRMAGNLTAMMGLGAQADTASQEQLIYSAASKKEASMQYRVVDGAVGLIKNLAFLLWNDRFKTIQGRIPIEGADGYFIDANWNPYEREGSFEDYKLNLDLYSMPYQSPAQRLGALNSLLTQIYAPMIPMLMQQGGQINIQKLTEIYAELLNEPRLNEIIQFTGFTPESVEEKPPMPTSGVRQYVRKNVSSGGSPAARSQVQQQAWLSRGAQSGGGMQTAA